MDLDDVDCDVDVDVDLGDTFRVVSVSSLLDDVFDTVFSELSSSAELLFAGRSETLSVGRFIPIDRVGGDQESLSASYACQQQPYSAGSRRRTEASDENESASSGEADVLIV